MRHKFRGRIFDIIESMSDEGGECAYPGNKSPEMIIPVEGESKYDLEVIIHEGIHACQWDVSEEAVREISHDIAGILWKLGWRKEY